MKKRVWIFNGLFLILIFSFVYWFALSKPTSFPTNKELLEEMNQTFSIAAVEVIQDTIFVDERHVLVPFISSKVDYGLSYWVWQRSDWKLAYINTKGAPMLWQVDKGNPASYHYVWNIDPKDRLSSIDFYLIRDRGYQITEGIHHYYTPRVQMQQMVSLEEQSYGTMNLPEEWVTFMNSTEKVIAAQQPNQFFHEFFPQPFLTFGYFPYNDTNTKSFPEHSVNGNSYSTGSHVDLEHVMILNDIDIEVPK